MTNQTAYFLGKRDGYAEILAETKDKVKLPESALFYEKTFGEKHFSHEWHTKKMKVIKDFLIWAGIPFVIILLSFLWMLGHSPYPLVDPDTASAPRELK